MEMKKGQNVRMDRKAEREKMGRGMICGRQHDECLFLSLYSHSFEAGPPRQNAKLMSSRRIVPVWHTDRILSTNSLITIRLSAAQSSLSLA